ncbi:MAG: hypothetical protein LCH30_03035 [Proteobacteria bacterium]|nr:hypothetical protein [Pseudomonadota bacterium]
MATSLIAMNIDTFKGLELEEKRRQFQSIGLKEALESAPRKALYRIKGADRSSCSS